MVKEIAPGFTVIDPAGDLSAALLTRLEKTCRDKGKDWDQFKDRIHYFDLGPTDYPLGLNLLHQPPHTDDDTVVNNAVELIKFSSENKDTPFLDRVLLNAIKTLVVAKEPHNILGIVPILINPHFRAKVAPYIQQNPILKEFWDGWEAQMNEKKGNNLGKLDSLLNRLSLMRTNDTMRRMFGQNTWGLNIRQYMDEGHIVILNASNLDRASYKLTAGLIITHYHWEAIRRPIGSLLHKLIIDEYHNLQLPVVDEIIAFDRKFGLSMGLCTQFLDQLKEQTILSISENVGTILTTRQGTKGATRIEKITNNKFKAESLMDLPERTVAVYTSRKVDGRSTTTTAFVQSEPPFVYKADGSVADYDNKKEFQAAIERAYKEIGGPLQQRDCKHIDEVDWEIDQYLKVPTLLETDSDEKEQGDQRPVSNEDIVLY